MSTYVVNVPNPPAGLDWRYTVPGQYNARLIGVTAVLTTTANPTLLADASGNGHDAVVDAASSYSFQGTGPFGGGAGNFAVFNALDSPAGTHALAQAPGSAAFAAVNHTLDCWMHVNSSPALGFVSTFHGPRIGSVGQARYSIGQGNAAGDPWALLVTESGVVKFAFVADIPLGSWHHVAVKWNGVQWTYYLDGVNIGTHVGDGTSVASGDAFCLCGTPDGSRNPAGSHASVAFYASALSDAQIAAHAAASGSQSAYQTAVLADSPVAYWPMNEVVSKVSRHANLVVTDGTTTVLSVPAGFSTTNAGVFNWSWQTLGTGTAQSADGSVAAVTIPSLYLPPGYTVGTSTPDLVSTDRWTNIVVWFTSSDTPSETGLDPFVYPPGAYLIIDPKIG